MSAFARFIVASLCLTFVCTAAAGADDRRLKETKAREVKTTVTAVATEGRELWINSTAKPGSPVGWNVIVSIICKGKYTTVNNIKLRTTFQKLGFPTNAQDFQFAGNAATTNWRSITAMVVNIPYAKSAAVALNAVQSKITVKSLNQLSKLPKDNAVVEVLFTTFQA